MHTKLYTGTLFFTEHLPCAVPNLEQSLTPQEASPRSPGRQEVPRVVRVVLRRLRGEGGPFPGRDLGQLTALAQKQHSMWWG